MADDTESTVTIHVGDSSDKDRRGGDGIDVMDLGSGTDTADAGRGYNIILGGSSADILTSSGFWDDVFGGGDDTITDFAAGTDKIDLSAIVSITSMNDLYCRQDGDDAVIYLPP